MTDFGTWLFLISVVIFMPPLCLGVLRKTKARLQNRIGAPIYQPLFDLLKLFQKREVLSDTMCGIFRFSAAFSLSVMVTLSWLLPWLTGKPPAADADIFFVIYFFAAVKIATLLGSMDAGSAFGAFAASREATLNFLLEPALCLVLVSLAINANSSNLQTIFALTDSHRLPIVWFFAGVAILMASLIELSRMPIDDPTTHLELTMVHEAMILEASGRNLFALQFSYALKMVLLWGLSTQCFLRVSPLFFQQSQFVQQLAGIVGIFTTAMFVGLIESLTVKLQWRKVPEFIAYVMTASLICAFVAVAGEATL